jgi:hypothetical protein
VLKFVKYLSSFGWRPVVLTVENGDFPARDESLLKEIPPDVKVYRTKIFEPYAAYRKLTGKPPGAAVDVENIPQGTKKHSLMERVAGLVRETFFIPDARVGWLATAVPEAMRIVRTEGIDAIYTSSPPYTTALIGREVKRRTRLPWIAGFRDPWTGFLSAPDRWFVPDAIDKWLEKRVFTEADMLDCAWQGIIDDFAAKFPGENIHKCVHLPNGFDPDDYPTFERPPNDRFTTTYTGSMYGKRNPQTFLRAVEAAVVAGEVDPQKIRMKFIGRFGGDVKEMLRASPLAPQIEQADYVPHEESVRQLLVADQLLLVVDESKDSRAIVPGKVFEYLGARRPILALADPEGAAAGIVRDTKAGVVVANQDVEGIRRAFVECYRNFLYHNPGPPSDSDAIRAYERREVTRRLAELLTYIRLRSAETESRRADA